MPAEFIPINVAVQLDNTVQPSNWGAPLVLLGASIVTDSEGKILYQPAFVQRPMAPEEFTDDILEKLNSKFSEAGLKLVRKV